MITYLSIHYCDVIMGPIASQITSLTIVYSTAYSEADQRKHQSSASLAFVRGIHRWPVNSTHKWPVTRKMLPFGDVIMFWATLSNTSTPRENLSQYYWPQRFIFLYSSICKLLTHLPLDKMTATLAGDYFKCIFLNENDRIPIWFSMKFVPRSPIDNKPALVQVI